MVPLKRSTLAECWWLPGTNETKPKGNTLSQLLSNDHSVLGNCATPDIWFPSFEHWLMEWSHTKTKSDGCGRPWSAFSLPVSLFIKGLVALLVTHPFSTIQLKLWCGDRVAFNPASDHWCFY